MIDMKQAVNVAMTFLVDLMDTTKVSEILLEEVESNDDERLWSVTLSALLPESQDGPKPSPLALAMGNAPSNRRRIYKVFTIDADTGKLKSMRMRSLAKAE